MDSQLRRSPHCWPLLPLHREVAVQAEKDERLDPPAMSPHFASISTARIHATSKPLPPLLQPTPPAAPSSSSPSSCFPRSRCPIFDRSQGRPAPLAAVRQASAPPLPSPSAPASARSDRKQRSFARPARAP
ncbi:hypothetical protein VPH35_022184 [Triticum aestivum]